VIVLGLSDSSVCGGATVRADGQIIASINEERLDRQKLSTGFPALALNAVLDMGDLSINDVDRVHVADVHNYFKPQSTYWDGWLVDHASKRKELIATISSSVSSVIGNSDFAQSSYYAMKRAITSKRREALYGLLREQYSLEKKPVHVDHHFCHATSAYYTAGYRDCTVITLDGGGDGLCSQVYRVKNGRFEQIHKLRSYHSIGNYYAYITKICGFTAHKHEGKITGLAAFGKPIYKEMLAEMIDFHTPDIRNKGNAYYWSAVNKIKKQLPRDFKIEDLAASMQKVLEDVVVDYCRHWIEASGISKVALAGGVFANVRLNQEIHQLDCVDEIFIHPGMGDEGLNFGAVLTPASVAPGEFSETLHDVYLGPDYTESEMEDALKLRGVAFNRSNQIENDVARLLADGYVVARFNGRLEYGPRALGNRSVLYQPNDHSANDWLNKHLDRTEFMPFAPAVAFENASRCFNNVSGAENTARFMTITFDCTEEMSRLCPGVTHVDGTARPQLVREEDNPSYYKIIREYERITGIPSIVNTSFNVHDEPIVCSPEDALNGFIDGDLDYLAMGPFLAEGKNAQSRKRVVDQRAA
jgi:carbamoyltransferase